jgi:hypothetical protein
MVVLSVDMQCGCVPDDLTYDVACCVLVRIASDCIISQHIQHVMLQPSFVNNM